MYHSFLIHSWWCALRLLPALGYCELCFYEHWGASVLLNWFSRILRVYSQQWNCWVQKAGPLFVFWGNFILFSTVATPVCITTNNVLGLPFLHNLTSTYCLLICLWWPFWLVWSGISLWFYFASLWWLVMLSIFSYVSGPFVCTPCMEPQTTLNSCSNFEKEE